jgi:hypothetical protein
MGFPADTVRKVWKKGTVVSGNDPEGWRQDQRGAWLARSQYGNRKSRYGWEIDNIKPESEGRGNELSNLRPLQWENNVGKQGGRFTCPIIASGAENVRR